MAAAADALTDSAVHTDKRLMRHVILACLQISPTVVHRRMIEAIFTLNKWDRLISLVGWC